MTPATADAPPLQREAPRFLWVLGSDSEGRATCVWGRNPELSQEGDRRDVRGVQEDLARRLRYWTHG